MGTTRVSQEAEGEGRSCGKGLYCGFCREDEQGRVSRLRISQPTVSWGVGLRAVPSHLAYLALGWSGNNWEKETPAEWPAAAQLRELHAAGAGALAHRGLFSRWQ